MKYDRRHSVMKCPKCSKDVSLELDDKRILDENIHWFIYEYSGKCVCGNSFKVIMSERRTYRLKGIDY